MKLKHFIAIGLLMTYLLFVAKLLLGTQCTKTNDFVMPEYADKSSAMINFDKNLYLTQLAYHESSNNFKAQNGQHVGLYQLSKTAYKDLVKYKKLDISFDSIASCAQSQNKAQTLYMQRQYDLFVHYDLLQYIGKDIVYVHANGIDTTHYKLNLASMYAASHLVGCKNLKRWIVDEDCNPLTDICDGNKMSIAEYAFKFRQL
jgi:hypothetical protein